MRRIVPTTALLAGLLILLSPECLREVPTRDESAREVVEHSRFIQFRGRMLPFSAFYKHVRMFNWVVYLQKTWPHITPGTCLINIDYHSDAYGGMVMENTFEDYRDLRGLNSGNWIRFLRVNNLCTGRIVLVTCPVLLQRIQVDRRALPANDLLQPASEYDDNWIFGDDLFCDIEALRNAGISGPAIVTIDYDYLAGNEEPADAAAVRRKARTIAEALFNDDIVPVAVNFTFSDRPDKTTDSPAFVYPILRDFVSRCLVDAFNARGAYFEFN
ncbi:MAG TPA: hypothetical protein ENN40_04430 [Candidatus Aminicenantes bacterium]|nr:hypothetical protein [Candidatus Aminicenantes bacterium]